MAYLTIDAEIDHGQITVSEPHKLPRTGRALLTVLESGEVKPDVEKIQSLLGTLKSSVDPAQWQQHVRAEWDRR